MVERNKIDITIGSDLDSNTYNNIYLYDQINWYNSDNAYITLGVANYSYSGMLTEIPVTDTLLLMHVKVELPNYVTYVSTRFVNNPAPYQCISYTDNPLSISPVHSFDSVYLVNPSPSHIYLNSRVKPHINSFSPTSITAGTGDILSIYGNAFGYTRENGTVLFKSADEGGNTFLKGLDDQYFVSWSDTLIQVIVPSLVYKGYETDTVDNAQNWSGGAGTGAVKIITAAADSCVSSNVLQIPFSITNAKKASIGSIRRVYLARESCDYDFRFTLHSAFNGYNNIISLIDTALLRWSRVTGLKMILERDSSGAFVFENQTGIRGKNIIYSYSNSTDNGIMQTYVMTTTNRIGFDTLVYLTTKSDIGIKNATSASFWDYRLSGTVPSGKYSFYNAFMHELGHILLLSHVIDASQLMYHNINPNYSQPVVNLTTSNTAVVAANKTITRSQEFDWQSAWNPPLKKIKVPTNPIITAFSTNNVICNNMPVTLTSSAPTGNIWSNGAITQSIQTSTAGTYTVSHREEECTYTSAPLTLTSSILNATFNVTNVICGGNNTGAVTTSVNGNHPPYSYHWTNNVINATTQNLYNLYAGQYSLSLSDQIGCQDTYNITVTQPNTLGAEFILVPPNGSTPEMISASASGGTPPYTYTWSCINCKYIIPANYLHSPSIPRTYASLTAGTLSLTVTDNCNNTLMLSPGIWRSLMATQSEEEITLYPNPSSGQLKIESGHLETFERVDIYDIYGKLQFLIKNIQSKTEIDVSNLSSGVYIVKIYMENNEIVNKKLIKC